MVRRRTGGKRCYGRPGCCNWLMPRSFERPPYPGRWAIHAPPAGRTPERGSGQLEASHGRCWRSRHRRTTEFRPAVPSACEPVWVAGWLHRSPQWRQVAEPPLNFAVAVVWLSGAGPCQTDGSMLPAFANRLGGSAPRAVAESIAGFLRMPFFRAPSAAGSPVAFGVPPDGHPRFAARIDRSSGSSRECLLLARFSRLPCRPVRLTLSRGNGRCLPASCRPSSLISIP